MKVHPAETPRRALVLGWCDILDLLALGRQCVLTGQHFLGIALDASLVVPGIMLEAGRQSLIRGVHSASPPVEQLP